MSETKLGYSLMKRLAHRELLVPYLENALIADKWPDEYTIKVDSTPYKGTGDGWFHPSSHALANERWLYYIIHPDHKDKRVFPRRTLQGAMTLSMGSALHAVVQTQMQMAELIGPDDIEVPSVSVEHRGRGNMDWRILHPNGRRYGCEMKTQNSFAFEKQQVPKPFWVAQLNCYMDWNDLDEGIILVVESGFPYRVKEFHISRNENLLKEIYDKWDRVIEAVENNTPPRHCCPLGSSTMESCTFRYECWLGENSA